MMTKWFNLILLRLLHRFHSAGNLFCLIKGIRDVRLCAFSSAMLSESERLENRWGEIKNEGKAEWVRLTSIQIRSSVRRVVARRKRISANASKGNNPMIHLKIFQASLHCFPPKFLHSIWFWSHSKHLSQDFLFNFHGLSSFSLPLFFTAEV